MFESKIYKNFLITMESEKECQIPTKRKSKTTWKWYVPGYLLTKMPQSSSFEKN